MGSCISKCRPKKYYIEGFSHVQDKVVISSQHAPKTPIPVSNKISPFPLSPTISSSSSVSPFTCTTSSSNTTTSSCSSFSSSKDRYAFSNEFLWACVKENPHIIRINSIKEASLASTTTKSPTQKLDSHIKPVVAPVMQAILRREKGSTPRKRGRSSSPSTLTRQKSIRKESDGLHSAYYSPSRSLRSPSPSRRFSGGNNNRGILASTSKEICSSKRIVSQKVSALNSVSPSLRKENFRPSSPMLSSHPSPLIKSCLRNRETFIHRISSKIDESAVRAALSSQQEKDSITMEDIDNPLISLDCFIFL
ncbi:uncharacterized protein LOC111301804 [Durio zibethinus]|uniref:Uncharacterized protein LOC111301804 n=1 Tax=Durio zibethinus TaxID=66656 RepID=A0A6P5ZKW6_DURZI|nr:uncharacterized protein LOC111301804 [Durio zibethinus]